jgi:hypothetical protein
VGFRGGGGGVVVVLLGVGLGGGFGGPDGEWLMLMEVRALISFGEGGSGFVGVSLVCAKGSEGDRKEGGIGSDLQMLLRWLRRLFLSRDRAA